jgi:hypothetical protein
MSIDMQPSVVGRHRRGLRDANAGRVARAVTARKVGRPRSPLSGDHLNSHRSSRSADFASPMSDRSKA